MDYAEEFNNIQGLADPVSWDSLLNEFQYYNYELEHLDHGLAKLSLNGRGHDWVEITMKNGYCIIDTRFYGINKFEYRGKSVIHALLFAEQHAPGRYFREKWVGDPLEFKPERAAHDIVTWWNELDDDEREDEDPPDWWEVWHALTEDDWGNPKPASEFYGALYSTHHHLFDDGMHWGMVPSNEQFVHAVYAMKQAVLQRHKFL